MFDARVGRSVARGSGPPNLVQESTSWGKKLPAAYVCMARGGEVRGELKVETSTVLAGMADSFGIEAFL